MLSPSSLFSRLEELKKWQKSQQERLTRQNNNLESNQSNEESTNESTSKTDSEFQVLLEEKLNEDVEIKNDANPKPKRPFLRKGTGLLRYRLDPSIKKPILKNGVRKKLNIVNNDLSKPNKVSFDLETLEIPKLEIDVKGKWEKTDNRTENVNSFNRDIIAQINQFAAQKHRANNKEVVKQQEIAADQSLDCNSEMEMLIFESLEQKAMNSSFCSTNSSVVRLLSSTPHFLSPLKKERNILCGNIREKSEESEIVERLINRHLNEEITEEEHEEQFLDISNTSTVNSEDIEDRTLAPATYKDDEPWSTDTASEEHSFSAETTSKSYCNASTNTDCVKNEPSNDSSVEFEQVLANKLKELDEEINSFRTENGRIEKLKRELQMEKNSFYKERNKVMKELEEETTRINSLLDIERQKIAKEKMVFEKYVKDSQNRPTKQERNELSDLRIEVASLKETLKLKESKNGISQARLRNHIKSLEKDNSLLKEEMEKLRKENGKLLANQRIVPKMTETKMLHNINKNLTKLAKDVKEAKKTKDLIIESDSSSSEDCPAELENTTMPKNVSKIKKTSIQEKENDRNKANASLEEIYLKEFGNTSSDCSTMLIEKEDGSVEKKYPNGNVKLTSADGNRVQMQYFNGDIKVTDLVGGFIKYTYANSGTTHTTFADGTEILEFPSGQIEKKNKDGSREITFPEGVVRKVAVDGTQETRYLDGSIVTETSDDQKVLLLPNGQKEIHTKEHKRREYPDGTVKILFPDGTLETRYANGRIRVKNAEGKLIMDSHE